MTTKPFYTAEIGMRQPAGSTTAWEFAWGATAWGAWTQDPQPTESTATLYVSDDGYTTLSTDAGGLVVYKPMMTQAFAIDREMHLAPGRAAAAWGFGSLELMDIQGQVSSLMASWNITGQTVTIKRGEKTLEQFNSYKTQRSTKGTYIDGAGVLQEAAANVVRWDYSAGSPPVALNEAYSKNWIRNPRCEGAIAADGVERITNGDFAADPINASQNTLQNGWYWSRGGGAVTATWVSNAVVLAPDGTNQIRIDTSFTTVVGYTYTVSLDISTNTVSVGFGNSQGSVAVSSGNEAAGTGRKRQFVATATTTWMRISRASVGNATIDNVSVKSAGLLPTYWTVSSAAALFVDVLAVGNVSGVPRVSLWVRGTSSGTAWNLDYDSGISGTKSDAWTVSAWTALTAGALTNITSVSHAINPSIGTVITGTHTPTSTLTRRSTAGTLSADATLTPRFSLAFSTSKAIDATFSVGAPQLEQASAMTTVIFPTAASPATSTRNADNLYYARGIYPSPALSTLTTLFTGMAGPWVQNETGITIPLRDVSVWAETPIQSTVYAGTGTYEGPTALEGRPKPKVRGTVLNVTPVEIDATNRISQWTDGKGTITALYERGATGITFDTNTSDLYTGSTTAGKYRSDTSRGLFQLGSTPAGQITCDVTGEFPVAGSKTNWADIAYYLLTEDCGLSTSLVDSSTFTAAASAYAYTAGVYFSPDDQPLGIDAVARVVESVGAKLIQKRNGKIALFVLRAPVASATPAASFGAHNILSCAPVPLDDILTPPPYQFRCGYQRNYTVQTDLSSSASSTQRQFAAAELRYGRWYDSTVLAAYARDTNSIPFGGCLTTYADAVAVATAMGALWGVQRYLFAVKVPESVGILRDIGDLINLQYPAIETLANNVRGQIVREQFRSQDDITFLVLV